MLVFINNEFVDEQDATIPISDRGLRFGDGIFDSLVFYDGVIYQEEKHRFRIAEGLGVLKIDADIDSLISNAKILISMNKLTDGMLRISVTRGQKSNGYLPVKGSLPTVIIEAFPPKDKPNEPVILWISSWQKPSNKALPVHIKTLQGLNSVLSRMEAQENHCYEALLLNQDEIICECSSSNIFWFKDDILYTPSLECGILSGTIRDAVIDLSPYEVRQGCYKSADLQAADEVFITNVNLLVQPVSGLKPKICAWNSHKKTHKILEILEQDIADYAVKTNN